MTTNCLRSVILEFPGNIECLNTSFLCYVSYRTQVIVHYILVLWSLPLSVTMWIKASIVTCSCHLCLWDSPFLSLLVNISFHNSMITVRARELTVMESCSVCGCFQTILPSIIPVIYSASAVVRNMNMHQSLYGILSRHFIFFPACYSWLLYSRSSVVHLHCFAAIYHLFYHKIMFVSYRIKKAIFSIFLLVLYMYCEHCGTMKSSWLHWF